MYLVITYMYIHIHIGKMYLVITYVRTVYMDSKSFQSNTRT